MGDLRSDSRGVALWSRTIPFVTPHTRASAPIIRAAQVLSWPTEAAAPYARLRHLSRSQPIGDRDLMIAAHAVALKATLVTNNVKHFSRLGEELRFENRIAAPASNPQ